MWWIWLRIRSWREGDPLRIHPEHAGLGVKRLVVADLCLGEHSFQPVPQEFGFRQYRRGLPTQELEGYLGARVALDEPLPQEVDTLVRQRGD